MRQIVTVSTTEIAIHENNGFPILIAFQSKYFLSPFQLKHTQELWWMYF